MGDTGGNLNGFEELECWQACRDVKQFIAALVKKYPPDERFRLIDNMLRAARSTTHNIAEGYGRFHYQENMQFCRHSRGSLYELKDQLICSLDEGFISREDYDRGLALIKRATLLVNGYIRYLRKRKHETTEGTRQVGASFARQAD